MALPAQQQLKYWGTATVAVCVALWFLGDVLLPFVLGAAIAYAIDPLADRLEALGLSRAAATAVISLGALLLFIVLGLLVVPLLVEQTVQLVEIAPQLFNDLQTFLKDRFPQVAQEDSIVRNSLQSLGELIQSRGGELLQTVLSSAMSLLNVVMLFVIVPVVTFYLLLDWDKMVARIDALLPRDHAPTIRRIAKDVDQNLAGFVRGMGLVCIILGTYYAIALMLVGLQFGLVVGVIAGALTFIPYVGALVGGALALGLAIFQFWGDWLWIVAVAAIFQAGQFVEGNILTPKLVGDSIGLHPVWLLLSLSVFGAIFGFIGLLVAVPVAAALGVIVRFFVDQYKKSRLYRGVSEPDEG
ncbi:AI-2E family transporter [Poseidonocella sedimentorum]|uniref:Predicted PurR-regulated permease PerM n=1 Tax=Poseidonocella sedimentorum TaxID=871652 RepID=A0A1I6EBC4_9RHOB|nr:AI-2E family transporter [Poseidonocella sedimentorum]SFR14842.1 Predicted PurR-regulated permease PerM [Poseidonocella sedimentorum]